jgi:hypothetical protein
MPATVRLDDMALSSFDLEAGQLVAVSENLLREAEEPGGEEPDLPGRKTNGR